MKILYEFTNNNSKFLITEDNKLINKLIIRYNCEIIKVVFTYKHILITILMTNEKAQKIFLPTLSDKKPNKFNIFKYNNLINQFAFLSPQNVIIYKKKHKNKNYVLRFKPLNFTKSHMYYNYNTRKYHNIFLYLDDK